MEHSGATIAELTTTLHASWSCNDERLFVLRTSKREGEGVSTINNFRFIYD